MDSARKEVAELGLSLRPRIFLEHDMAPDPQLVEVESASEQSSPETSFTKIQTHYLKTHGVSKGVLQIHRASRLKGQHA